MADVSVTAANVAPIAGSTQVDHSRNAGAAVTAGQTVYLDSSSNTWKLADANLSAAAATVRGIAVNGAASGQPLSVALAGQYTCGFTASVGAVYVLSATAGGIAPVADLATGMYTNILGVGITSAIVQLSIINSGVQVP